MDKRKYKRYRLSKPVTTLEGEGNELILDLSREGCKLKSNIIYDIGEKILLTQEKRYKIGEIVWKDQECYGVEFIQPIKVGKEYAT
jgi:hypothetical protein